MKRENSGRYAQKFDEPIDTLVIGIRLFKKDRERINAIAKAKNMRKSELIRTIVRQWLSEKKQ